MTKKAQILKWLEAGLLAVDPEPLTRDALSGPPGTVIAIGKAAPAMLRGAAQAGVVEDGICVTNRTAEVPEEIELFVGDHPVPGDASLTAGKAVREIARAARGRLIALISGGGSALCEVPRPGVTMEHLAEVNQRLLASGASIEEANRVRCTLSAIKCGGLQREARVPIETYLISDVAGAGPGVVASGPTIENGSEPSDITVLADGRTAAHAVARASVSDGIQSRVVDGWLTGPIEESLDRFISTSQGGITVIAGEPTLKVTGDGKGGRNSHAALLAARRLIGTEAVFAAFATDGIDGTGTGAGAIVDGTTIQKGGDPIPALRNFDSATYLQATGDLIRTGPTGTNVSDLWVIWRPGLDTGSILTV